MKKIEDTRASPSLYYPWFDWLRAACACTVMLFHDGLFTWSHAGGFAVQVFFALSGWLIGGILLKTSKSELTRFYFNRAVRIWIPYYFAVGLLLVVSLFREPITPKWLEIVAYKLTFVYNLFGTRQLAEFVNSMPQKGTLSHVWSVNAEEQFYLAAPILLVLMANRLGRTIAVWCAVGVVAWLMQSYAAIALGVLAAVVVNRFGEIQLKSLGRTLLVITLLVSGIAVTSDSYYAEASPFAAIAIVLLLAVPSAQHRFGEIVGGMSYPLYLNHWIGAFAFNFLMPTMKETPLRWGLSATVNIGIAMALFWWIEKPLLSKRGAWFTDKSGRVVTFVAYAMVAVGVGFGLWMMK